jgi:uracil-DNA glycosylase
MVSHGSDPILRTIGKPSTLWINRLAVAANRHDVPTERAPPRNRFAVRRRSIPVRNGDLLRPNEFEARLKQLRSSHMRLLERWRETLVNPDRLPHFDPADGGTNARILLLLETPAPSARPGPRFASRDNASGSAVNLRRYVDQAGLDRRDLIQWNAVPWAAGEREKRRLTRQEIREGLATLPTLLALLPRLRCVLLVGRVAQEARPVIEAILPNLAVLAMPHPSPANVCTSPSVAVEIEAVLAHAARLLRREGVPISMRN